jgi:type III secretion protein L
MTDNSGEQAPDLPKAPGTRIIRAAEESAWRDGYRFLAEVNRFVDAERAKGFAEGRAEGLREASRLVLETSRKTDRYLASLEQEIAGLAFDIVRRVLSEFDGVELVARSARDALADFRNAKAVRVRVHPGAEGHVRKMLFDHQARNGQSVVSLTVEADPLLAPFDCILSTDFAVIEATIETQLAAIAAAMRSPPGTGAP